MFEKTGHVEVPLDLMVASTYAQGSITLQDLLDLTSHLPRETPLYAMVFDDDGVEYSRQIVSAAIRVARSRDSLPATCIELKVQVVS
jgi:hypothetical protein